MPSGAYVRIEVSDTGSGIPPEIQKDNFEPFFTTKELGQGTGLGLPSVLGVVEQHGGFISLVSRPGEGTVFILELPVAADGGNRILPHIGVLLFP